MVIVGIWSYKRVFACFANVYNHDHHGQTLAEEGHMFVTPYGVQVYGEMNDKTD